MQKGSFLHLSTSQHLVSGFSLVVILMSMRRYPVVCGCFVFCCFVLAVLGLCCFVGLPLVGESGGYSLVAVLGLLILVASLTAEHGL